MTKCLRYIKDSGEWYPYLQTITSNLAPQLHFYKPFTTAPAIHRIMDRAA